MPIAARDRSKTSLLLPASASQGLPRRTSVFRFLGRVTRDALVGASLAHPPAIRPLLISIPARRSPAIGRRLSATLMGAALISLLLLGGCSRSPGTGPTLSERASQLACVNACRETLEECEQEARFEYRQCQAGYSAAFRDYRWCLASALERGECGYPWWACAENRFGYCSNRATECERACRTASAEQTASPQPPRPVTHHAER